MLPQEFVELMRSIGLSDLPEVLMKGEPEVSVRLNPRKPGATFEGDESVPWCREGLYLDARPQFTLDPRLHQGAYYVQEASSMIVSHIARTLTAGLPGPRRALDACAAPGGKTTALIDALPAGSAVVANEFVPARAAALRENIVRWGYPGVIVTRADTRAFSKMRSEFDIILADVPCSGEGMMRKDPHAVEQWSPGLVRECAALQRSIVDNLWPALRPGGYMIYSTCTFNPEEDEDNVRYIVDTLGGESVEIPVDPAWGITPSIVPALHCMRFIPGRTRGEGLFAAVIRKPGELHDNRKADKEPRRKGKELQVPPQVKTWIRRPEEYQFSVTPERITAFPAAHVPLLRKVSATGADIIHEGIPLAAVKGRDLIPAHALALSTELAPDAFPQVELSLPEALDYLRGRALTLPADTPRGYVAVTYGGRPLGWMKHLGNRSNNLYPDFSRIKTL